MGQVEGERQAKMMQEGERNGKRRGNPLKPEAPMHSLTFIFFGHQFRKAYTIVHWNDDGHGMRFMLTLTLLVVQLEMTQQTTRARALLTEKVVVYMEVSKNIVSAEGG